MGARIGLVLGAGGVVGHAFHAGVLSALADEVGFDPRRADLIVGTSAGSSVAAMLRAGVSASDLAARATGQPLSPEGTRLLRQAASAPSTRFADLPRQAGFRLGLAAPGLLARAAVRPWEARLGTLAAAVLPPGAVPTEVVSSWLVPIYGDRWPADQLWVCAVALSDGRRVVFGRPGSPPATVPDAVAASCAIPGFFSPVDIAGIRYVDGGAHSPTNADVLAGAGFDLVVISSPMSAARPMGRGLDLAGRRLARVTLGAEVAAIRRRGTPVLAFQPTAEDRAVMGVNGMDPARRHPVTVQARASTLRRLARHDLAERLELLGRA